ncbi:GNAT superfamily N-acetyltransferase [Crossiella equi]|uniref:GNAT superfamily N-acetyltransferase n=1 Tax=Crossiella equi TaxID=130796 RepID=A0ABS5A8X9_9PSEU|nr:GNAT family N-acetyltransferase [Crossiella equi]MBP2473026.1 GNAT superfamily N-acetyltransferase [Crossiella equi]
MLDGTTLTDIASRPDLRKDVDALVAESFADFMFWESPGNWRWHQVYDRYPDHHLCLLDRDGRLVAAANSLPLAWDGRAETLPGGWDDAIVATIDHPGATFTATCMLSLALAKDYRRSGAATTLLDEVRRRAAALGRHSIALPVRPTSKVHYPLIPMADYLTWTRPEGDLFDPWLRTHVELGGEVLGLAPRSLVIRQPKVRWEEQLGRPMPGPGSYLFPGGLVPVELAADGFGTYAEPNVWMRHGVTR